MCQVGCCVVVIRPPLTRVRSMDRSVSKMLCLHIPSLLPAPFAEIEVAAASQTAALIGIGLLYQGTGKESARNLTHPTYPN